MKRLCLTLVLAASLGASGCSEEPKEEAVPVQEAPPLPVETVTTSMERLPIWLEYTGKTEAGRRVEINARVSGRLEQVLFAEGDLVEQGETLFVIEPEQYQAELAQARAQLAKTEASLELARKDVERYRPLVEEDLAPRITLEQNLARVAELEATIEADQARIAAAELNLSYTEIEAPISGRVGRRLVDVGNTVGYGSQTSLATIIDDDPMYAYFNPSERDFQIMQKYQSVDRMSARIRVPGDRDGLLRREPVRGVVDFADNRVEPMTGTITMRARFDNPQHTILEGTFVNVEVMVTDQVPLLAIPPAAIQEDQRGTYVYLAGADSTAERAEVTIGYESRHYLIVTDGLSGGEQVVISGLAKTRPGTRLKTTDVTGTKGVPAVLADQGMLSGGE